MTTDQPAGRLYWLPDSLWIDLMVDLEQSDHPYSRDTIRELQAAQAAAPADPAEAVLDAVRPYIFSPHKTADVVADALTALGVPSEASS